MPLPRLRQGLLGQGQACARTLESRRVSAVRAMREVPQPLFECRGGRVWSGAMGVDDPHEPELVSGVV